MRSINRKIKLNLVTKKQKSKNYTIVISKELPVSQLSVTSTTVCGSN